MHILLVEDDKISLKLLSRVIESEARDVVTPADDGEQAWGILSDPAQKFDACIFDIFMPKMSGMDVVEKMRATDRYRHTPVILCTAVHDRATVQRAAALSVAHYVIKPYSRALMLDKLRQIRTSLSDFDVLEESTIVCSRLGIEADMHRVMLKTLLDDIAEWGRQLRAAGEPAEVQKLFIRCRGIKGSCLSLGARGAARQFNTVEATLQEFLAQAAGPFPGEKAEALLGGLERELQLVGELLKTAA